MRYKEEISGYTGQKVLIPIDPDKPCGGNNCTYTKTKTGFTKKQKRYHKITRKMLKIQKLNNKEHTPERRRKIERLLNRVHILVRGVSLLA